MSTAYQKIALNGENIGTISNVVMMDSDSFFDPAFNWVPVDPETPAGIGLNVVIEPVEVLTGYEETFEPFVLSEVSGGFAVSYSEPNVIIACKTYDMVWLRQELTNLCKNNVNRGTLAIAGKNGVLIEEYCIVWNDANLILSKLESLQ